jgi:thiamine-phosphate pyrophosphorylase
MSRHLNKNYIENFFFFTDQINNKIINQVLKFKNISVIYNTLEKSENLKELGKIQVFCKKNNIKLYITNNYKLAIKVKSDGVFLNKQFKQKLIFNCNKLNFKRIVGVHSQQEYYQKTKELSYDTIISPIFYNNKYSINKILNPIKFNLLSLNWRGRKYALGGINLGNLKKTYLTTSYGVGFISLIEDLKIKKPACFFNRRAFY